MLGPAVQQLLCQAFHRRVRAPPLLFCPHAKEAHETSKDWNIFTVRFGKLFLKPVGFKSKYRIKGQFVQYQHFRREFVFKVKAFTALLIPGRTTDETS